MCKVPTTKKKLVQLIWGQGQEDESFTQEEADDSLGEDVSVGARLRAAEAEKRRQCRRAEQSTAMLQELRAVNLKMADKVGSLEAEIRDGAASKELTEMNESMMQEIGEVQEIANEALNKVSTLEDKGRKLEADTRAHTRTIGQVKYQNEQYCRQYEQMKESEKKSEERLKTYKYIDLVLAGGDEAIQTLTSIKTLSLSLSLTLSLTLF